MILSYLASRRRLRQAAIPALAHITPSPWRQGWRQLRRNRLAMFCLLLHARKFCFFSEDKNCGKRRHLWQESVFSICNPHL